MFFWGFCSHSGTFLPTANLVFPIASIMAEKLLYLPAYRNDRVPCADRLWDWKARPDALASAGGVTGGDVGIRGPNVGAEPRLAKTT